jgi:hypothetical protein
MAKAPGITTGSPSWTVQPWSWYLLAWLAM